MTFQEFFDAADGAILDMGLLTEESDEVLDLNYFFVNLTLNDRQQKASLSLLNRTTYDISIAHEIDGVYDEYITYPTLAYERPALSLYVLLTHGFFHRIRVEALADKQRWHLRIVEATMYYEGQLS